jgi:GNAT superfamily N-acetyltransferase
MPSRKNALEIAPLSPSRWADFVRLFGPRGACGGCWCMTPRLTRSEYEASKGSGNRRKLKRLVDSGTSPGVLGYLDGEPIAWCAIEPREAFSSLQRSRILKPVDDRPVWSIVCLFVHKEHRGAGVSVAMIEGAVAHARAHGARIVEAYPVEPKKTPMPPVFAYTGIASAYRRAGFKEVARRSPTRPIMRRSLRGR